MTDAAIKLVGPDLASRKTAGGVRRKILAQAAAGNRVIVDLAGVESVSFSFADELFGVLAALRGWEWLSETVRIAGAKEHVLRVIAEAVDRRLKERERIVKRSA